ncbi:MAG: hypothetical protein E7576_13260 [Ruminococcaceae bacterium]|jgi:cell division protein FtsL|nr:hypothetical protein [Oscillospiraceae bacterium]
MADEFAFANQLKSEFRGRGADVSGMQATSTSELMHRAEMGRDPRENVSEEAFRENYRARRTQNGPQYAPSRPPVNGAGFAGSQRAVPGASRIPAAETRTAGGPGASYSSRPGVRTADRSRIPERDTLSEEIAGMGRARQRAADGREERIPSGAENTRAKQAHAGKKKIRVEQTRAAKKRAAAAAAGGHTDEIELKRGSFPVALIALTLIAVLIIFTIVESFAKVYQTSSEIARMKAELEALKEEAAGLELKLDEKNDIRTIREIAVGELGMAEEDSMQRRFVSVSGGERIEVLEAEEDSTGAGGVLFSSLGESVSRFAERFR